ncbi:MAG: hypothetical protein JO272_17570 [Pseudonocardiales bacterium]|nr:hypothetical protein [Pseudonocardiales bacterium]
MDTLQSPTHSEHDVVAVAVCDGFYGCGSGAGWSNRALIEILAEVLPVEVDLVVLPVRVDEASGGWQHEWRHRVEDALGRSGRRVEVRALEGDRGGPGRHGEPALTGAAEREVTRLRGAYRRGLIVLCDVGFSGAAARSIADSAWTTVIVPRTSALLVCPELAERVAWERQSLRRAAERGVRIAAISGYMRSHLTEQIGVPASAVIDLHNGLSGVHAQPTAAGMIALPPAAWGGFLAGDGSRGAGERLRGPRGGTAPAPRSPGAGAARRPGGGRRECGSLAVSAAVGRAGGTRAVRREPGDAVLSRGVGSAGAPVNHECDRAVTGRAVRTDPAGGLRCWGGAGRRDSSGWPDGTRCRWRVGVPRRAV